MAIVACCDRFFTHVLDGAQIGEHISIGGEDCGDLSYLLPFFSVLAAIGVFTIGADFVSAFATENRPLLPDGSLEILCPGVSFSFQIETVHMRWPAHVGERRGIIGGLLDFRVEVIRACLLRQEPGALQHLFGFIPLAQSLVRRHQPRWIKHNVQLASEGKFSSG